MRLTRVKIENHHHLQDLELEVRQHMVLIGPNNAGKSSLLRCLDLLLGASTAQLYNKITYEDLREPDRPLIIEAELCEFSQGSLFSRWEDLPTSTGGRSERTCHLAWSSLLTETSHVWGH